VKGKKRTLLHDSCKAEDSLMFTLLSRWGARWGGEGEKEKEAATTCELSSVRSPSSRASAAS
jgi:hypothetical protein